MSTVFKTFPGMTVECSHLTEGSSRVLFDGIFATGGITLSQVCIMTGLEPYLVQNWVKRGFLTSPVGRVYSREQFARVVIINMLKQALQIDRICGLIRIIAGEPNDRSDDLVSDDELYHRYVNMLADPELDSRDEGSVMAAAERATEGFAEPCPGARKKLCKILAVMLYAHRSSQLATLSEQMLSTI